jgi:hypothetical protein
MPALVVPEVATTAASEAGSPSALTAARSAAPVSRWSSVRTVSASISSSRSVLTIDEWASVLTATRKRPPRIAGLGASPGRPASADRLAAEPPDTKHPPADAGSPARSAISRSTSFSAWIAPAASSHEMPWIDAHETSMSNSSAALVGARGNEAEEARAVRRDHGRRQRRGVDAEHLVRVVAGVGQQAAGDGGEVVRRPGQPVEGTGVEPQPVLRVREHRPDHLLGGGVHVVHARECRRPARVRNRARPAGPVWQGRRHGALRRDVRTGRHLPRRRALRPGRPGQLHRRRRGDHRSAVRRRRLLPRRRPLRSAGHPHRRLPAARFVAAAPALRVDPLRDLRVVDAATSRCPASRAGRRSTGSRPRCRRPPAPARSRWSSAATTRSPGRT